MKRFYQSVLIAVTLCVVDFAYAEEGVMGQAPRASTLKEAIEKAVTSNPEVQARYHNYLFSQQDTTIARAALLPHLDVDTTYRRQEKIGPNIDNTNIPERQTQLVLRQLLFDGFASSGEVNRLGHASRVRYYELLSAMENTALEVVKAYIDIQRYRQLVDYAKDNYVVHKQLFERIEERVTAGVARRVDLEQASGRLALAEANLLTETTNLHDVQARYQRLVGELPPEDLPAVDFYNLGVSPNINEALQLAYTKNPDLLSTIENIEATRQEVKNKRAKYSPRLDLEARTNLDTSKDGANSVSAADVLQLTLSFNLFNGFADMAGVEQTVDKLNNSLDSRDKACVDTRQTLVIAYNDTEQLKEQLIYRNQHQLSIEKAREAYRKQFDIGQRSLLDLLDTENEYFQARRTYTVTENDLYTAYARTYAAEGELLSQLGVTRKDIPDIGRPDYLQTENVCEVLAPIPLKIDKPAIVAQAKPLSDTLVSLAAIAKQSAALQQAKPADASPAIVKPAPVVKFSEDDLITSRAHDWAAAWEQKDVDAYLKFYAEDFVPENKLSHNAWVEQRKQRISKPSKIKIMLRNMKVTIDGDKASVEFTQLYSVPGYSDNVTKELKLEKLNNVWVIVHELVK
ncbi:MAG TPA: TolC family outer membrane protein [Methylophilaceae bacterium]|jgi:adhesin transport system outer membrane protein